MALNKFTWQNGTKTENAKVEVGGVSYDVTDAQYEGETPLSASNLNLMQDTLLGNVVDTIDDESKIASIKAIKNKFTTTERLTKDVWEDGKPIYDMVISGTSPSNTEWTSTGVSVAGHLLGIYEGYISVSSNEEYPFDTQGSVNFYRRPSTGLVMMKVSSYFASKPFKVRIKYTKE